MSTGVEPQTPSVTPTNASAPSVTSPSPAAPGSTSPGNPEFRYGSEAPAWAQGKTANEVLGIAQQLEGVVRQHINTPKPAEAPRDPQTGQFTPTAPTWSDTDYLTGADIRRVAPGMINDAIAPQLNGLYESLAQTNLNEVRRSNAVIFEKYGPEVYAYVAKLPIPQRTVDNLTTVVKLVRADHVEEEIARARAVPLPGEIEPVLRSTGSPSVPVASTQPQHNLQSDAIPQDWKDRAAKAGLTESAVDEFCRANDITREAFFSQFGTTAITEARR